MIPPLPIRPSATSINPSLKPRWHLILSFIISHQGIPHIHDCRPARGEHGVLQAVEILAVDGRHEFAGCEAFEDARWKVVFADAGAELEVLVEHDAEGERDGLSALVWIDRGKWEMYLEVYVRSRWRSGGIRGQIHKLLGISKFKTNATYVH